MSSPYSTQSLQHTTRIVPRFKHGKGECVTGAVRAPNGNTKVMVDATCRTTAHHAPVTLGTLQPPKVTVLEPPLPLVLQHPQPLNQRPKRAPPTLRPRPYVEAAGAGPLVAGAGEGAGDATTLGAGVVPVLLPRGAEECPELRGRGGPLSDMWRLSLPWYCRWEPLRRQLRILLFHVSNVEPSGSCVANSGLSGEKTFLKGAGHQRRL